MIIWPDELTESALLSRDTNELEILMGNALNITHTDESLVQELTKPLGNYLFRDDFINGNVLCKSFNDVCQCSAFSDKEFIMKFNRLNSILFKINLFECATTLIQHELASRDVIKSQPTLTPFVGSGVEDLVLDLSHLVGSDGRNLSGPDSVINILTIKLSEDKTIRLVTEEKFNELATTSQKKELSCLNEFLHKFYHNYQDRKKNKRKKADNARELEELRKRLSTDSVLSSSTTNSQDNSTYDSV